MAISAAYAADYVAASQYDAIPARVSNAPAGPPRRYLTTYIAKYPFGNLREDYTPLGAPGVSKAAYFGRPMWTATLHVPPRRWRHHRRVVSARY